MRNAKKSILILNGKINRNDVKFKVFEDQLDDIEIEYLSSNNQYGYIKKKIEEYRENNRKIHGLIVGNIESLIEMRELVDLFHYIKGQRGIIILNLGFLSNKFNTEIIKGITLEGYRAILSESDIILLNSEEALMLTKTKENINKDENLVNVVEKLNLLGVDKIILFDNNNNRVLIYDGEKIDYRKCIDISRDTYVVSLMINLLNNNSFNEGIKNSLSI